MLGTLATLILAASVGSSTGSVSSSVGTVAQQGGNQGNFQRNIDSSIEGIARAISGYINEPLFKSILTPGEFNDWTLKLKAGQVVIGEADSEAFDPAIEIVDEKGKVLANNDDRFPGDQRPLILWRCTSDGSYSFRVRCFHDKSGGSFVTHFRTFDCVDLGSGQKVEQEVDGHETFLAKMPMRGGQIKELKWEQGTDKHYIGMGVGAVIAPGGLPEEVPSLAMRLNPAIPTLVAPVSGDYYVVMAPFSNEARARVHMWSPELVPTKLSKEGNGYTNKAPTDQPAIWELNVKAGEILRATTPELDIRCQLTIADKPDFSKFDISKPETNPFFPHTEVRDDPSFERLTARTGDERINLFRVRRDATLWLSSNAAGPPKTLFTLNILPGTADFAADRTSTGNLRIADTDWWAFDAKAGDVMALGTTSTKFADLVVMKDPDMNEIRHYEAGLDVTTDTWRMIVQKPGRYLMTMSCLGNGGGGEYSLTRKVFHSKEFSRASPAKGEIASGQVQVWTFKARPEEPKVHSLDSRQVGLTT